MAKRLYVGNMSYDTTDESLKGLFSQYGEVESVDIITDKFTGKKRGFGFVTMVDDESAKTAIEKLHDAEFEGRKLIVNEAREKSERGPRQGNRGGFSRNRY